MSSVVTVRSVPGAVYTTEIEAGNHAWLADEPADVNGDDLGPDPYDLLLAALGSCTTMTLHAYARRKSWPLAGVTVRLRHERHAAPGDDGRTTVLWEEIRREIDLVGPLDGEQRQRLREIAERCPVHRTIVGDLRVIDEVVEVAAVEV
jgi:putative redox protein